MPVLIIFLTDILFEVAPSSSFCQPYHAFSSLTLFIGDTLKFCLLNPISDFSLAVSVSCLLSSVYSSSYHFTAKSKIPHCEASSIVLQEYVQSPWETIT